MITCAVEISGDNLVAACQADYPISANRFSIMLEQTRFVINAQDFTAFKAALNAVYNTLAVYASMQQIP